MGRDNVPERDWGLPVWTPKPSKSVRDPHSSGKSFVGIAVGIMSVPVLALLSLAGYLASHYV